jgi:hypothetical protein
MGQTIKCQYNLFREGRTYSGHHRNYILESARNVCMAPETRERIRLREAFGYFGHGRRQLAGKLNLSEVETVRLPGGQSIILENVPSNVTTYFQIDENGNVEHHQEILEHNKPGQIVLGLHKSRVGGFSWAMDGSDGGARGKTTTSAFYGFDYVLNPGFAENRGFVLESADAATRDVILENICQTGKVDGKTAEAYLDSWLASVSLENIALQDRIEESAIQADGLREKIEANLSEIDRLKKQLSAIQGVENQRRKTIMESARTSRIAIPQRILDAIIEMADEEDFHHLTQFFETARQIDLSTLPLPGAKRNPTSINPRQHSHETPEYGTVAAGRGILSD